MRVLVFNPFNDRSEVAMYLGLVKAGITVELACDPSAPEKHALKDGGVIITELPVRSRLDIRAISKLRAILTERKPDIIYTTINSTLSCSLIAATGLDIQQVAYRGTIGHISRWDPACWLTYLNPWVDRIVCVSEAVRKYLLGLGLPADDLITIYKGHDPSWYDTMPRPSRSELGIPDNSFLIGFTGRMRPVKGADVLVKSMHHLSHKLDFHLLLVGSVNDPDIKVLADHPSIRKRIHLTGPMTNAAAIAGVCDVFVMPSVAREGLPRSVIEAMAQGVPCIVSNVGGMPELVVHNESGMVVDPGDPQALAQAINILAKDPEKRSRLGNNARDRISSVFNIRETIQKHLALFTELAPPGP